MKPRSTQISRLTEQPFDLLIVGGGIVGAGIARDAAMRGLSVALIDRHDFAYGTSSRSSRLLHGGLRYLEQGHIGLVREASIEKQILHRIAPHLAKPLPFIFPVYRRQGRPLWQLTIGVKLYDLLCRGRNFGPSSRWSMERTKEAVPELLTDKLRGAVRYYDAFTNDGRLVLDTLIDAERYGACTVNYMQLLDAAPEAGGWTCQLQNTLDDTPCTATARCVISATGPWAARVPHSSLSIRPTKGVHLVVDRQRLPIPDAVVMPEGRRILFAIPWGERTIIGTTDTDFSGPPEEVKVERGDIDYVLKVANRYFPKQHLTHKDIRASWAGLRPLIAQADAPGEESEISRTHEIVENSSGWIEVAGGKLTTYRLMAEQAVDRVCGHLRDTTPLCRTAQEPIPAPGPTGASSLTPTALSSELVQYYCQQEMAQHLEDIMCRRTKWLYYLDSPLEAAQDVASQMAVELGWTDERTQQELASIHELLNLSEK